MKATTVPTRRLVRAAPILAAFLVVGLVSACSSHSSNTASSGASTPSSPPGSSSLAGTTITLYNAQHEQTTNALIAAFTAKTGIKVRVDNDDEDVLTAQIEQEGSRSPADVFYTENSNWLAQLDQKGMLAPVDQATLASVPAADSATDGTWVGISARMSVMVYNPGKVSASQLPTSVLGLADPQWKGKIELAPAETDFWPIVDSVDRTYGDAATIKWLKGLKANAGSNANVPDNETIVSDINKGVAAIGIINHYYYYRLGAEIGASSVHAKLAWFAPKDPGYIEDISGAAVLKSSKHQAAAQEFLAFLTSEQGQEVLVHSDSFEYPIHPGVAANSELTPLNQLSPADFTPADLGTGLNAKNLLQEAGLL
jgi:iron(III) transport system substrate-binding protein